MTTPSLTGFDLRVIIETPLRQFVPWLAIVILVSLAGYLGVVCITPMAWLIALRVGNLCVAHSKSALPSRRLIEAALAGAIFGFLQGLLFVVIVPFMGPIKSDEMTKAIILTLIMIIAGMGVGTGLSLFTAYLNERRRQASS